METSTNTLPQPQGNLFKYSMHIEAENTQEANTIMESLVRLYYSLSNEDLAKLAEIVEKRPDLVEKAKHFI